MALSSQSVDNIACDLHISLINDSGVSLGTRGFNGLQEIECLHQKQILTSATFEVENKMCSHYAI